MAARGTTPGNLRTIGWDTSSTSAEPGRLFPAFCHHTLPSHVQCRTKLLEQTVSDGRLLADMNLDCFKCISAIREYDRQNILHQTSNSTTAHADRVWSNRGRFSMGIKQDMLPLVLLLPGFSQKSVYQPYFDYFCFLLHTTSIERHISTINQHFHHVRQDYHDIRRLQGTTTNRIA